MKAISAEKVSKCNNHEFSLKPLQQKLFFSRKINISFCNKEKKYKRKQSGPSKVKSCSGHPILNIDKNYATPAFIHKSEEQHFIQNKQFYMKDHSQKIRQYQDVATDLYFPAPKSSYQYCNVCCCLYVDYVQHINTYQHHHQIKTNKFNHYILEIENQFKINHFQNQKKRSYQERFINIDEEEIEISSRKKIKTQEPSVFTNRLSREHQEFQFNIKNYYSFNNYMTGFNTPKTVASCNFSSTDYSTQFTPNNYELLKYYQNQFIYGYYGSGNQAQPQNYMKLQQNYAIGPEYYQQNHEHSRNRQNELVLYGCELPMYQFLYCFNDLNQYVFTW